MTTSATDIRARLGGIRRWASGDRRAAHKPLLLLMVLARLQRGQEPASRFAEDQPEFASLFERFGQPGTPARFHYPFWRLQADGLWQVATDGPLETNASGDVRPGDLVAQHAVGRLPADVAEALRRAPELVSEIAGDLVDLIAGESQRDEVLDAVGMPWVLLRRPRDPGFRARILDLYDHACVACGFHARLGPRTIAVEAAHVRWHRYAGPDDDANGLALCAIHHKALDAGAIGIGEDYRWQVSRLLTGTTTSAMVGRLLGDLRGVSVATSRLGTRPAAEHVRWHRENVFRGEAL